MLLKFSTIFTCLVLWSTASAQHYLDGTKFNPQKFVPGSLNREAPPETAQLGQLIGIWEATRQLRNQDGSWSEKMDIADWIWYYILEGHAIQDDWILPSFDVETDSTRFFGTNIRIYNSKDKVWEMAWIDQSARKVAFFKATHEEGKVIMTGDNNGRKVRNTFYEITSDSFKWVQEWTFDGGVSWVPVAKISCVRKY